MKAFQNTISEDDEEAWDKIKDLMINLEKQSAAVKCHVKRVAQWFDGKSNAMHAKVVEMRKDEEKKDMEDTKKGCQSDSQEVRLQGMQSNHTH